MRIAAVSFAGVFIFCALATMAAAQPAKPGGSREDTLDNLVRRMQLCGETPDPTNRLQCYDDIARSMGGTPSNGAARKNPPLNSPVAIGPGSAPAPYTGNAAPPDDPDRAYNPNDPNDRRSGVAADPYPAPPQQQIRRSGPGPLPPPGGPIVTLQTSNFGYNDQRYWQVTIDIANNIGRLVDSELQCSFTNGGRAVKTANFVATAILPGEHISTEVLGPPTTTFVDGVTCQVLSPLR